MLIFFLFIYLDGELKPMFHHLLAILGGVDLKSKALLFTQQLRMGFLSWQCLLIHFLKISM